MTIANSDGFRTSDGAHGAPDHGARNPVARASDPAYIAIHATRTRGLHYLFVARFGRTLEPRSGQHAVVLGSAGTTFGPPQSRVRLDDGFSAIVLNEELCGRGTAP